MTTFAEKLKYHRESLGLNQQQLADMIGVSKRMVAAYETTNSKPRQSVLEKIAAALNVSVDYLQSTTITDPHFGIEKDPYVKLPMASTTKIMKVQLVSSMVPRVQKRWIGFLRRIRRFLPVVLSTKRLKMRSSKL